MLRHLLLDYLRRSWSVYAAAGIILGLLWGTASASPFTPEFFVGLSLSAAFVLGPLLAVTQLSGTEILLLPVSRRDLWRAMWLIGTALAAGATLIAKLIAVLIASLSGAVSTVNVSLVGLSSLLDFAYGGCLMALLVLLRSASGRARTRAGRGMANLVLVATAVLYLGGVAWGLLFASYLPTQWSALAGPAGPPVLAAIGLAIASFFHVPPAGAGSTGRFAASTATARQRPAPTITRQSRELTGLRLLWTRDVLIAAAYFLAGVGMLLTMEVLTSSRNGVVHDLRSWKLLPFEKGMSSVRHFPLVLFGLVAINSVAAARERSGSSWRQFRVLPLSTARLAGALLLRRVLAWLSIWLVLVVVHVAATRALPATLRPELLAICLGLDALVYALQVRFYRYSAGLVGLALAAAAALVLGLTFVLPLAQLPDGWIQLALFTCGALALIVAAGTLQRALLRAPLLYAPTPRQGALEGMC